MAIIAQKKNLSIFDSIENHQAWMGRISGLKAEKLLRNQQKSYLYILRAGETVTDFYITFVTPTFSVKHQPFTITDTAQGWYYENWSGGGPYTNALIDDVLHLVMHCNKEDCTAFEKFSH